MSPANVDVINQLALLLIDQPDQAKRERAVQFAGISCADSTAKVPMPR